MTRARTSALSLMKPWRRNADGAWKAITGAGSVLTAERIRGAWIGTVTAPHGLWPVDDSTSPKLHSLAAAQDWAERTVISRGE